MRLLILVAFAAILALPASAAGATLQAEDACSFTGGTSTEHAGYTGSGFVDLTSQVGSAVVWAVAIAPNPTTGRTALTVTLSSAGAFTAKVFDVLGRQVQRLADVPNAAAGPYRVETDLSALRPDLYVIRVQTGGQTATHRVVVTR